MASQSNETTTGNVDEGLVARSPFEWAKMVLRSQSIPVEDPQKDTILWNFGLKEHAFSSGSDLTLEDYLRLHVLWNTWPTQDTFRNFIRDDPKLPNDEKQGTPYTGYVSPENEQIADAIYNAIKPELAGYLADLGRIGKGDTTSPSEDCGVFYTTRDWQGMMSFMLKKEYDEDDKKTHFRGKVRKSDAGLPQVENPLRDRPPSDEYCVNMALIFMLQAVLRLMGGLDEEGSPPPLAAALSKIRGLRHLHWLPGGLLSHLTVGSSGSASPTELIEARIGGYLCRKDYVQSSRDDEELRPNFNRYPLAILDAKPFTRDSALSAARWQESAQIACWVSELDDRYEDVGLLHSSTSGRKRRLLISQARDELWIIIAEYGDEWKQYIRGNKMTKPADASQSQDGTDLDGSKGFVSLAQSAAPGEFQNMMDLAEKAVEKPGSTKATRGPSTELPGPEYFCIMHQWGPYETEDAEHMDVFIRRVIGLQVQLLQNWPACQFQHPYPE